MVIDDRDWKFFIIYTFKDGVNGVFGNAGVEAVDDGGGVKEGPGCKFEVEGCHSVEVGTGILVGSLKS
jgi:hypothetical protein